MITNFQEAISQLQGHLESYLQSKGIHTSKKFRCLSPSHGDRTPSCVLLPDKSRFFCHGCSERGDLFDAIRLLEGKPSSGPLFITETLEPLAERFGVPLEKGQATPEQAYELSVRRAYQTAAEWVSGQGLPESGYVTERGWAGSEAPKQLGIGYVPSYQQFIAYMVAAGFEQAFLQEIDLTRTDIFGEHRLIFPTHDEHGRVVGFTARDLEWVEGCGRSKYINQQTTGLKCDVFQKGHRLYGIHLARRSELPALYLMEGQGDVITARHYGITNCAAVGGTSLTKDQVLLLKQLEIREVILCFDGDIAGQKATERVLDQRFSDHKELRVRIISLPDNLDPEEYLRREGREKFEALARPTAFEWRLQRYLDQPGVDHEQVTHLVIPLIVSEPSHVTREDMAKTLARSTGYSFQAIQDEIRRLSDVEEAKFQEQRHLIIERAFRAIEREPGSAEVLLAEAQAQLGTLVAVRTESQFSEDDCLRFIHGQETAEETAGPEHTGFVLGADLLPLQRVLMGEWTKDVFCILGGKANSGKTSLCTKLAVEIASHLENDACVIYHSIDDTLEQVLPKFVCVCEGSKTGLFINEVRYPAYWAQQGIPGVTGRREAGYRRLTTLVKDGRLVLRDSNHGNGLSFIDAILAYYRRRYPTRKLVFILDNFHKLPDYRKLQGDERLRFKAMSDQLKGIATRYHAAVITTAEYTKVPSGVRPSNYNLAETVQLSYDANLIAHIHNDLHDLGGESSVFHMCNVRGTPQKLPIIECFVGKNKITDFKDSLFFRFYPASSDFEPATPDDLRLAKERSDDHSMEDAVAGARTHMTYRSTGLIAR